MTKQKYPLDWPVGYPRTDKPQRSAFKNPTLGNSVQNILEEVNRLNGWNSRYSTKHVDCVISSNVPLRDDGMPRADYLRSSLYKNDKGVAVYFKHNKTDIVICCDRWDTVESNMHAIYKTIEAMRSIDRWGVSDFIQRSFTGFKALPSFEWWKSLEFSERPTYYDDVVARYRQLAKIYHPDMSTGSADKMHVINFALQEAKKYFGQ